MVEKYIRSWGHWVQLFSFPGRKFNDVISWIARQCLVLSDEPPSWRCWSCALLTLRWRKALNSKRCQILSIDNKDRILEQVLCRQVMIHVWFGRVSPLILKFEHQQSNEVTVDNEFGDWKRRPWSKRDSSPDNVPWRFWGKCWLDVWTTLDYWGRSNLTGDDGNPMNTCCAVAQHVNRLGKFQIFSKNFSSDDSVLSESAGLRLTSPFSELSSNLGWFPSRVFPKLVISECLNSNFETSLI